MSVGFLNVANNMKKLYTGNKMYILTFIGTAYILIAFAWWSLLLIRKNEDNLRDKLALLKIQMTVDNIYTDDNTFKDTPQYQLIMEKHNSQKRMIWGEGSVMFLGLLWGIWAISLSFKKEMALANQRRNFLLSITHELKSPIASIQLVLQTFQKRKLDMQQAEMLLNSANKETDRLNELVNNLLLSAKLETAYEPIIEEINIQQLLNDIVNKISIRFPKADIKTEAKEVPILRGDRQGLVSVFTNLIENAIKYSPDAPKIRLKYWFDNGLFKFEVIDNGLGIHNAQKRKVFEKFYRIGNEDTRKTKGTGLGLYIVEQIVKAHQGSIKITDNIPKGSIFHVTLPN